MIFGIHWHGFHPHDAQSTRVLGYGPLTLKKLISLVFGCGVGGGVNFLLKTYLFCMMSLKISIDLRRKRKQIFIRKTHGNFSFPKGFPFLYIA